MRMWLWLLLALVLLSAAGCERGARLEGDNEERKGMFETGVSF